MREDQLLHPDFAPQEDLTLLEAGGTVTTMMMNHSQDTDSATKVKLNPFQVAWLVAKTLGWLVTAGLILFLYDLSWPLGLAAFFVFFYLSFGRD